MPVPLLCGLEYLDFLLNTNYSKQYKELPLTSRKELDELLVKHNINKLHDMLISKNIKYLYKNANLCQQIIEHKNKIYELEKI